MKFKTLKYCSPVDSKFDEFASIEENGFLYTHQHPVWLGDGVTLDDMKNACTDTGIKWEHYRIVEIEYFEANTVGADIRNKLTPCLNLVALLKIYFGNKEIEESKRYAIKRLIKKEMELSKKNIKYIANLL